jgi:hypothetical protein
LYIGSPKSAQKLQAKSAKQKRNLKEIQTQRGAKKL